MYERILMPMDGSACSEIVLEHGLGLARLCGAEVTFLHVMGPSDTDEQRRAREEVLGAAQARAQRDGVAAEVRLVTADRLVTTLLEIEQEYDLIVVATHGRRGADRLVLGSVSEGVIRQSDKPHLVVRCELDHDFDLIDHYRRSTDG